VSSQPDKGVLEVLIQTWQELAARMRRRAEATADDASPPADYWYGIAFALEMTATQLLTAMSEIAPLRTTLPDNSREWLDSYVPVSLELPDMLGQQQASAISNDSSDLLLNKRVQRLLDVLQAQPNRWFKRADIAHALGNKSLSSSDMTLLQVLVEQGHIDFATVETNAPSGRRYQYRAKLRHDS
jgi:hypothetical protein